MKKRYIAFASSLYLGLTACATVLDGSTQEISIVTPDVTGASCLITQNAYNYHLVSPGKTTVEKSRFPLTVTCKKDGYQDGIATIPSSFAPAAAGNIILGDWQGLGIDYATGAMHKYPSQIAVVMAKL